MKFYTSVIRKKNNIVCIGYNDGEKFIESEQFQPEFYFDDDEGKHTALDTGKRLSKKRYQSMYKAYDRINSLTELDIKSYGTNDFILQYINRRFDFKDGAIEYDPKLIKTMFFDIEVDTGTSTFPDPNVAKWAVTAISFSFNGTVYLFALKTWKPELSGEEITDNNIKVVFKRFDDDKKLLNKFFDIFDTGIVDNISGWNSRMFDVPYIITRAKKLGMKSYKKMSPIKEVRGVQRYDNYGKEYTDYKIIGLNHIDYLEAYKKFTYNSRKSYKLDYICEYEGIGNKIKFDGSLSDLWKNDPQKYLDYSIYDTYLLYKLDEKLQYMNMVYRLTYSSGTLYENTLKTVKQWEDKIYNWLIRRNIVPYVYPIDVPIIGSKNIVGGFVKKPKPNIYRYAASLDAASLYPHCMMYGNLGLDTMITKGKIYKHFRKMFQNKDEDQIVDMFLKNKVDTSILNGKDIVIMPNGTLFRTDTKSFTHKIMHQKYQERKTMKGKMLDCKRSKDKDGAKLYGDIQQALKIDINSAYGAYSQAGFLYYNPDIGNAITSLGRLSIKVAGEVIDEFFGKLSGDHDKEYMIYTDTDSVIFSMDDYMRDNYPDVSDDEIPDIMNDVINNELVPVLEKRLKKLQKYLNAPEQYIVFKREKLIKSIIYTDKKKRYATLIYDNEGVRYDEPKLSVTGMESVRSTTPDQFQRDYEQSYRILLDSDKPAIELKSFIDDSRKRFMGEQENILKYLPASACNNILKYTDNGLPGKGSPRHVRGAIMMNAYIDNNDLRLQKIQDGTSVYVIELIEPNPFNSSVVSMTEDMLYLLDDRIVNRNLIFEKQFKKGVDSLSKYLGLELYTHTLF